MRFGLQDMQDMQEILGAQDASKNIEFFLFWAEFRFSLSKILESSVVEELLTIVTFEP